MYFTWDISTVSKVLDVKLSASAYRHVLVVKQQKGSIVKDSKTRNRTGTTAQSCSMAKEAKTVWLPGSKWPRSSVSLLKCEYFLVSFLLDSKLNIFRHLRTSSWALENHIFHHFIINMSNKSISENNSLLWEHSGCLVHIVDTLSDV